MPESVTDPPDLEVRTHCSGLCLGGLSIWPNVRRENVWPYGLKTSICSCLWKMSKIHSCSISSLPFDFSMSAKFCLETFSIFTNSLNPKLPFIWINTLWLGPCGSVPSLCYLHRLLSILVVWDDKKKKELSPWKRTHEDVVQAGKIWGTQFFQSGRWISHSHICVGERLNKSKLAKWRLFSLSSVPIKFQDLEPYLLGLICLPTSSLDPNISTPALMYLWKRWFNAPK